MTRRSHLRLLAGAFALAAGARPARAEAPLALLVVKSERKLHVLRDGHSVAAYWIALGARPVGPKEREGDRRTPEGRYVINEKSHETAFHGWLGLSYPNADDVARAAALGVAPGGRIAIHGLPEGWAPVGPGRPMIDWTNGCIAMTNHDLDELWAMVDIGTPVEIRP